MPGSAPHTTSTATTHCISTEACNTILVCPLIPAGRGGSEAGRGRGGFGCPPTRAGSCGGCGGSRGDGGGAGAAGGPGGPGGLVWPPAPATAQAGTASGGASGGGSCRCSCSAKQQHHWATQQGQAQPLGGCHDRHVWGRLRRQLPGLWRGAAGLWRALAPHGAAANGGGAQHRPATASAVQVNRHHCLLHGVPGILLSSTEHADD